MKRFENRTQAGRYLAKKLTTYAHARDAIVLGLPRGGVVVAFEIAKELKLPLDIFLVRKLGVPGYEELAMGAIASGGIRVMNEEVLQGVRVSDSAIEAVAEREERELKRRETAYRNHRPQLNLKGLTVILVDDGLATGATMRAAALALQKQHPKKLVIAVPVASQDACDMLRSEADEIICGEIPSPFYAVGAWYQDFSQTTDDEVRQLLAASEQPAQKPEGHHEKK